VNVNGFRVWRKKKQRQARHNGAQSIAAPVSRGTALPATSPWAIGCKSLNPKPRASTWQSLPKDAGRFDLTAPQQLRHSYI